VTDFLDTAATVLAAVCVLLCLVSIPRPRRGAHPAPWQTVTTRAAVAALLLSGLASIGSAILG
jgi:hypothetical protein